MNLTAYIPTFHFGYLLSFILLACQTRKQTISEDLFKSADQHNVLLDTLIVDNVPVGITRSILSASDGSLWFATFNGLVKKDQSGFQNELVGFSDARYFSAWADSKNRLWFGTIGDGVFCQENGQVSQWTTKDGLLNNEVPWIYEDQQGYIWFGVNGGLSRYDGSSFKNYRMDQDTIFEVPAGLVIENLSRPMQEVNAIAEDKYGQLWIGTRNSMFLFDGTHFQLVRHGANTFENVRSIIEDKRGAIWFGGNAGLWKYDESGYQQLSSNFTGFIFEDSKGNIWTSSETNTGWAIGYYASKNLLKFNYKFHSVHDEEPMIFGIGEDISGKIWAGTLNGVFNWSGERLTFYTLPLVYQ